MSWLVAFMTAMPAVDRLCGASATVSMAAVGAFLGGVAQHLLLQARFLTWWHRVGEVVLVLMSMMVRGGIVMVSTRRLVLWVFMVHVSVLCLQERVIDCG
jgi:hypothetical protein